MIAQTFEDAFSPHWVKTHIVNPTHDLVLKFQHKLRMSHKPVFLEHISAASDLLGRLSQADPQQEGVFRHMEDPVPPLGEDHHC